MMWAINDVVKSLENHVDKSSIMLENSNQVLNRLIHSLNEVALLINQMKKGDLATAMASVKNRFASIKQAIQHAN